MNKQKDQRNINGIFLMLVNTFATSMLYIVVKFLTGFITPQQVVFFYKSLVLIGIIPWILYDGFSCIKTKKLKLHLMRGFFSTIGALLFFYGLSSVDIASATALNKMEPIFLLVISALFFKEKLSNSKIYTAIFSFIGMLFVLFPIVTIDNNWEVSFSILNSNSEYKFNYNYLVILIAVICWTVNSSLVKSLGKTESNRTQLFYISVISVLISMPAAVFQWEALNFLGLDVPMVKDFASFDGMSLKVAGILLCLAMLHFMHVSCYFQSLKVAEMSVVVPFDYTRMVFAGILGYCFFEDVPNFSKLIGYALILSSGIYLMKTQYKRAPAVKK